MVAIAVNPLVLKDYTLKIAADNYEKAVDGVTFTPSGSTITWSGPIGSDFTDAAATTWKAEISYVQDWRTAGSLSRYLFDHDGETVSCTFVPSSAVGEPSFTADLVVMAGAIGGKTRAFATTSVTLGVRAKPLLVPAV